MGKLITGIIIAAAAICGFIVIIAIKKSGKFIKNFFLSSIMGITSLFAVNAAGTFTGVSLNVNPLTLISGIIFGSPGIAAHLIIQVILR